MPPTDVTIEKLIYGGDGLAHDGGSTIFVPFVLPAERVGISPVEQKKKFVRARLDRVVSPSPDRATARCRHFSVCGGCHYQHIPYDAQLTFKAEILRETLRRIGHVDWTGPIATYPSQPWAYRNRAQWKVRAPKEARNDQDGEATPESKSKDVPLAIGYFQAASTTLCAVEDCSILSPLLLKTLLSLRGALAEGKLPRQLREIEAFANPDDSKLLLTATFSGYPSHAEEHVRTFRLLVPEMESLLFHDPTRDRMELFGPGFLEYPVRDTKYRVGHFSFFQVNRFLVDDLQKAVTDGESGKLAIDLFAGVGLFSAALAGNFERVIAVESNPAATRDMETNVLGLRNIEVRTAVVEKYLDKYRESKPDLIVLDPPRDGLEPGTAKRLAAVAPARITYVSCEPPTLARDLGPLVEAGYSIADIQLFDLFPQTFHMETIVRLVRRM